MKRSLYVLCGGGSTRMGSNKALLRIGGKTLLDRVLSRCKTMGFTGCYLLSGGRHYETEIPAIEDYVKDAGPLSAIAGALNHTTEPAIAVTPVDMPLLKTETYKRLAHEPITSDVDVYIGRDKYREHPLTGIYSTGILDHLKAYLDSGERSVHGFLKQVRLAHFYLDEEETLNVNHPEDFERLYRKIEG